MFAANYCGVSRKILAAQQCILARNHRRKYPKNKDYYYSRNGTSADVNRRTDHTRAPHGIARTTRHPHARLLAAYQYPLVSYLSQHRRPKV